MGTSILVSLICCVSTLGGILGQHSNLGTPSLDGHGLPTGNDITKVCGDYATLGYMPWFCTTLSREAIHEEEEEEMFTYDYTVESRQDVYPPQHPVLPLNDEQRLSLGHVLTGAGGLAEGALVAQSLKNNRPTPSPVVVPHPNYGYPNTVVHTNPVVVHPNTYGYTYGIPVYHRPVYSHLSPYQV